MEENQGMFITRTNMIGHVLCCTCGIPVVPNAANMCSRCLRSRVDITEGLQKQVTIIHCPECNSYLQPPRTWIRADLESSDLLTFCVKRLKNMNRVKVVNAHFIWTEPHSKKLKVKLKIQKEVFHREKLEQAYEVEFTLQDHMCESCTRSQANPDQWVAVVQLRQRVAHRRTFFYLEQLILKHGASLKTVVNIKETSQGIDFFFGNKSHAGNFAKFLRDLAPIRNPESDRHLVSHNVKSNKYNYRYTLSLEICPICREDLICLPPKISASLGNLGPLVVCTKVTRELCLLDPFTLRSAYVNADWYWSNSFGTILNSRQLVEYIVLDIDFENNTDVAISESRYCFASASKSRYRLARAEVARLSDFGKNDTTFSVVTFLGHLLKPGDYAFGYDLYAANSNNVEFEKCKERVSDAILIKKSYEEKRRSKSGKARHWRLKSMNAEVQNCNSRFEEEKRNTEYEDFLKDLEENPELRFDISLYRNKECHEAPCESASTHGGDDFPSVPMEELLADLSLSDAEGDTGEPMEH